MDTQTAKANLGKPFKYLSFFKWDTILGVTADGYIHGEIFEAPAEDCRLKQEQPEALKKFQEQKTAKQ